MAKKIITEEPGRTFNEFSLLTGYTKKDCRLRDIRLETMLSDINLDIPLLSASMMSVTGYEMALALGKEGGIGILPARLSINEQTNIVEKIKAYEMSFVEEPITVRENATIEQVLKLIERHGYSKIPVVDRNNTFLGIFLRDHYLDSENTAPQDNVVNEMVPFGDKSIPIYNKSDITVDKAKELLSSGKENYLIVLDEQDRFIEFAFKKDMRKIKVGSAITTYEDWSDRVKQNIAAGSDLIVIDTSDAYSEFALQVIRDYKSLGFDVPLCAGNVITYEGAKALMEGGADMIKIGMSSGSICTTQREKATGRAPMTALIDADRARNDYLNDSGKYVSIIMDGGITSSGDMVIALTIADAVMMGGYFNRFYEAAGEKFDSNGIETRDESEMVAVASWGEGSQRAKNLDRYGHTSKRTFFEEGIEGNVPYLGRLKPNVKKDLMKIKAALSNAGCYNLKEFRNNAVIELNSLHSSKIVSTTHSVNEKN
ncbi:IMP dehydrogenase [Candidatus Woesearchaeota archaeon]|jgi:IMP dehydrogenase|nr:IMP dehydrogenase [Candidatus Woesearchaeota archaeon]